MKLKFRAEKKDIIIFLIYSVLSFITVGLITLNLGQFANEGSLHGLNPIPIFYPENIFTVFIFWLVAMLMLITAAGNHFWEREKGLGVKVSKKEKSGYSRWLEEKEMKNAFGIKKVDPSSDEITHAGIPVVNDGRNLWVDDSELHTLVIGSTGSGKSQLIANPTISLLARKGESIIVTDPKGELYKDNYNLLKERGYNIILLNFREPQRGNSWNPFTVPYNFYKNGQSDKAVELLEDLGVNITHDDKTDDPFWQNTSGAFFAGLSIALFEDAKEEEININSINRMTVAAEERHGSRPLLNTYFSFKDINSPAYINASSALNAPNETKGGILSVFKEKIKIFASRQNISEMLSKSDFDMRDIGRKKTAVFICLHDEKKTYHVLGTIFLKQCYEVLIDEAGKQSNGKLTYRTNFILDEFANMPALKDISTMVSAARSRNIRMTFIIQDYGALENVYGANVASTIKGNCNNLVYLVSTELKSLEEISKLCGEKESKKDAKTASTPLATISDLQRLPRNTVIILHDRSYPFKTKFTPFWQMNEKGLFGKRYDKADFPEGNNNEIKIFDILEFTKKKQEEELKRREEEEKRSIDAALAELEKVTRKEEPILPTKDELQKFLDSIKQEDVTEFAKPLPEEKPVVVPETNIIETNKKVETPKVENDDNHINLDEITDDEFFDDFFSDDE